MNKKNTDLRRILRPISPTPTTQHSHFVHSRFGVQISVRISTVQVTDLRTLPQTFQAKIQITSCSSYIITDSSHALPTSKTH